jgi:hypothetical protein
MYGGLAGDSSNMMYYGTSNDPVYWIDGTGDAAKLYIKPDPSGSVDGKIFHISYPVVNIASSEIGNFPEEASYLVVLYASCKALQVLMNDKSASLPSDIDNLILPVIPSVPTISAQVVEAFAGAPTYTSPVAPVKESSSTWTNYYPNSDFPDSDPGEFTITTVPPVVPTISSQAVDAFSGAPTYIPPVAPIKEASSTWASYFPNADFPDSDPGEFTINSISPVPPASPSISSPGVTTALISGFGTAPAYTAPTIATTARTTGTPDDLTDMVDADWGDILDFDFDGENIDFQTWFQTAGYLIQEEEDIELAQAQLQKITTYINAYSQAMQNQLNVFNDANVEYQATIQKALEQARINSQENQKEADLTLQASIQDYTLELQKYQAEVSTYQANVGKEVQQYQQRMSRYQLELGNSLQAWQSEENNKQAKYQSDLQKYNTDIQNALNQFNDANVDFQADIQHKIKESDLLDSHEAKKLQKYQSEISVYQAEVGKQVQQYQQKMSRYTLELGNSLQAWQTEEGNKQAKYQADLQKYGTDIQDALNKFNEANVAYQADIQENIQEAQLADAHEARKIQKYQAEVGIYSAEVNAKVQKFGQDLANYNAKMQKQGMDYQWLQSQYSQLKQDYMQGISILKDGGFPQQGDQ